MTSSRLADCWVGIMLNARCLIAEPEAEFSGVAPALIAQLDFAITRARDLQYSEPEIRESLFAIVAWIDETAMTSSWAGASNWRNKPLQRHYFSTTRAGIEFFQRLEGLPEAAINAREVFGLTLLAGFAGRYASRPGGELADYRHQCLQRIARDGHMQSLDIWSELFSQVDNRRPPTQIKNRRRQSRFMPLLLLLIPVLALSGLYISLDRPLKNITAELIGKR